MSISKKTTKKIKAVEAVDIVNVGSENSLNLIWFINYIGNEKFGVDIKDKNKKNDFLAWKNAFKQLDTPSRDKIVRFTAEEIRKNYFKNIEFKSQIHKLSELFGLDRDWDHINLFLECLFVGPMNFEFITKICEKTFMVIDDEHASQHPSMNVIAICLALISEIGFIVKKDIETVKGPDKFKILFFIEFLTSNMIARSNVNDETLRVGLVYYFSRVEPLSQINIQKILTRFGQSLLENVLTTYFCNNKKSDLAFYFITSHLDDFIFSSAALAEMSNSVLQHQMLKHPEEFPLLMKKYISFKMKNMNYNLARSLVVHLSFLLKEACDVHQKVLVDSILEIIFSIIYLYENKSREIMVNLYDVFGEIIATSRSAKAKEITAIIYDRILSSSSMLASVNAYKLVHLDIKSANVYTKLKSKIEASRKPSPLDEILLLAG